MDFQHFNVHWKTPSGRTGKTNLTALSKQHAKDVFENLTRMDSNVNSDRYPFEAKAVKVIGPLGVHKTTDKQKLAQRYGYLMGSIKGAKTSFRSLRDNADLFRVIANPKIGRAVAMVDLQFSKLERDLRDLFRLAGLKIK